MRDWKKVHQLEALLPDWPTENTRIGREIDQSLKENCKQGINIFKMELEGFCQCPSNIAPASLKNFQIFKFWPPGSFHSLMRWWLVTEPPILVGPAWQPAWRTFNHPVRQTLDIRNTDVQPKCDNSVTSTGVTFGCTLWLVSNDPASPMSNVPKGSTHAALTFGNSLAFGNSLGTWTNLEENSNLLPNHVLGFAKNWKEGGQIGRL